MSDFPDSKLCPDCGVSRLPRDFRRNSQCPDGLSFYCREGGLCPICSSARAEHVDHDHASGAVRAVLCFNCNAALGQFKDDPDVLRRAAKYVEGDVWRPISIAPGVYQLPS